jgi:hypothetical protein
VVVNSNGKNFFATLLPNDILVEVFVQIMRFEKMLEVFALFLGPLFHHDFIAKLNTLVADVDAGSGNQFFDFFLTFPAERTAIISGGCTFLCHKALFRRVGIECSLNSN